MTQYATMSDLPVPAAGSADPTAFDGDRCARMPRHPPLKSFNLWLASSCMAVLTSGALSTAIYVLG